MERRADYVTQLRHITGDVEYWENILELFRGWQAAAGPGACRIEIEVAEHGLERARELEWERRQIRDRPLPGQNTLRYFSAGPVVYAPLAYWKRFRRSLKELPDDDPATGQLKALVDRKIAALEAMVANGLPTGLERE